MRQLVKACLWYQTLRTKPAIHDGARRGCKWCSGGGGDANMTSVAATVTAAAETTRNSSGDEANHDIPGSSCGGGRGGNWPFEEKETALHSIEFHCSSA